MKYLQLIEEMTLEEKASFCVGNDDWNSVEIKRLGIPPITVSDGPHGLRYVKKNILNIENTEVSTCFPSAATIANSWDIKIIRKMGEALGKEAKSKGVDILLGPGINIKRSPLCGRNFEYFSEDPYLTGTLAKAYVRGVQSQNVGTCLKHFACNNQETRRRSINEIVDERALREIYLKAFEIVINGASPWSVMSAYNKLNGYYCSENVHLLYEILRKEWKFDGLIISDWGAENDRVSGVKATHEIEMPAGNGNGVQEIVNAVKSGEISEDELNEIVNRILTVAFRRTKNEKTKYDEKEHHELAEKVAEESIVLLKNTSKILPLKDEKIAVIGDLAKVPRYQGAGSSEIKSYKVENAIDNFKKYNVKFDYAKGYERKPSENDEKLRNEAVKLAKDAKTVVIFAGLTEIFETEGMDRTSLDLPENQNELIDEICKVNKNVVVVLSHGSVISMPWKNKVKGIITGYLGGEAGAEAMVKCLIGLVNPSGKLAESYPLKLEDNPSYENFPGSITTALYKESIYVGYRYYDKNNIDVLFPFGYGLSYTTFKYSSLDLQQMGTFLRVSFRIKNTGTRKGKEVAQVYVAQRSPSIFKPEKELMGFEKVELRPGEEKIVTINLDKRAFEYYSVEEKRFVVDNGVYYIMIGKSSRDIVLKQEIKITSQDEKNKKRFPKPYKFGNIKDATNEDFEKILGYKIPEEKFDMKNIDEMTTIEQIKDTKVGKIIWDIGMNRVYKLIEEGKPAKAGTAQMELQIPMKRIYLNKSNNITKEMVDELIEIAKVDGDYKNCRFLKEYAKSR